MDKQTIYSQSNNNKLIISIKMEMDNNSNYSSLIILQQVHNKISFSHCYPQQPEPKNQNHLKLAVKMEGKI